MQPASITLILVLALTYIAPAISAQNNLRGFNTMNKQIIQNFASAINEHNVEKLCLLMTDDHKFIDSQGNETV